MSARADIEMALVFALAASLMLFGCAANRGGHTKICKLHRTPMEKKTVVCRSGMFPISPAEAAARKEQFPNDGVVPGGGCLMLMTAKVWVCPQCKEASEEWLRNWLRSRSLPRKSAAFDYIEKPRSAAGSVCRAVSGNRFLKEPDFRLAESPADPDKILEGLPAGATVKVRIRAINETGPGPFGEAIQSSVV